MRAAAAPPAISATTRKGSPPALVRLQLPRRGRSPSGTRRVFRAPWRGGPGRRARGRAERDFPSPGRGPAGPERGDVPLASAFERLRTRAQRDAPHVLARAGRGRGGSARGRCRGRRRRRRGRARPARRRVSAAARAARARRTTMRARRGGSGRARKRGLGGDAAVRVERAEFAQQRPRLLQRRRRAADRGRASVAGSLTPQAASRAREPARSAERISGGAKGSSAPVAASSHRR